VKQRGTIPPKQAKKPQNDGKGAFLGWKTAFFASRGEEMRSCEAEKGIVFRKQTAFFALEEQKTKERGTILTGYARIRSGSAARAGDS
jgi:hypothetical protein